MFLEECKYVVKENKIPKYIINKIEISSDSDEEISNEENANEETSAEENSNEENQKNTHMVKLIFKACKKTDTIFFYIFFYI